LGDEYMQTLKYTEKVQHHPLAYMKQCHFTINHIFATAKKNQIRDDVNLKKKNNISKEG
jgi:hypothetical protein